MRSSLHKLLKQIITMPTRQYAWGTQAQNILSNWLLPSGLLCLLVGLTLLKDYSSYHKTFYLLIAAPTLIALLLNPRELRLLLKSPIILAFLLFAGWSLLSLLWSTTDTSPTSLAKRPLYIFLLFAGCALICHRDTTRLTQTLSLSAVIILPIALYSLVDFAHTRAPDSRLVGTGALQNPLLSSHLFGLFCAYWLARSLTMPARPALLALLATLILGVTLLATGSRTPFLAMGLVAVWLCLTNWNRRALGLVIGGFGILAALIALAPETLTNRGLSARPELWKLTLELIQQRPWIGHGLETHPSLYINFLNTTFREPHSFSLGVLYYTGGIGLAIWLFMHAYALGRCWLQRQSAWFVTAGALLIYGLGAGLTEGGGILSRPKEHWFLIWIPLAIIAALEISQRRKEKNILPTSKLDKTSFDELTRGATTLEEDGLGPKVLRLQDGTFLKLFRRRHILSSETLSPYAQRFSDNAQRLASLGFTSPKIISTHKLEDAINTSAVRYQPLPGETLRSRLTQSNEEERRALVSMFGEFLAQLHQAGIYFRSVHLGNVLCLPDGRLGLIDLADMTIGHAPLGTCKRLRNLKHMQRYAQDRQWLFETHSAALLEGYARHAPANIVRALARRIA